MQPSKNSRAGRPGARRSAAAALALGLFVSMPACTSPASSRFAGGADWTDANLVWFARSGFVVPANAYNFRVAVAGRGGSAPTLSAELQSGASACTAEFRLSAAESERLNRAFRELSFCRGASGELSILTSDQPVAGMDLEQGGRTLRLIRNTRITSADRICGGEAVFGEELKRTLARGLPADCPTYDALFATDRLP